MPLQTQKILGSREAFSSYFFMSKSNKNDQIVVTTLQHVTIIGNKFLNPNGIIENREVLYWQKFLWEEKIVKLQVVLKVKLKDGRIKCYK